MEDVDRSRFRFTLRRQLFAALWVRLCAATHTAGRDSLLAMDAEEASEAENHAGDGGGETPVVALSLVQPTKKRHTRAHRIHEQSNVHSTAVRPLA